MMEMPPLPGSYWPVGFNIQLNEDAFCKMQLLSFGESCARMAREEAAKLADANGREAWERGAAREKDMWDAFAAAIRKS